MKKFLVLALAVFMLTGTVEAQYKSKHLVIPIQTRASAIGVAVNVGDFIYVIADSAMYMSKVAFGRAGTGTYLLADTSRYAVAKLATGVTALTVTTLAGSGNATIGGTLGVTGATTLAGALNAAGACGFGASNNKVTIAAATGNTAIAGTLVVSGASITLPGATTITKTTGNANSVTTSGSLVVGGNDTLTTTHIAGTNAALSGTLGVTGVATFTAAPVLTAGIDVNTTDTITAAAVGTLCYKNSDSTLYIKVRLTGTTGARWKKCVTR